MSMVLMEVRREIITYYVQSDFGTGVLFVSAFGAPFTSYLLINSVKFFFDISNICLLKNVHLLF